jgi:acetyl esterase/lipase
MNRWGVYFIIISVVLIILLTAIPLSLAVQKQKPSQPNQPIYGPGGTDYQYSGVNVTTYGEGQNQYWIFEPDSKTTLSAPVIVFMHGWGAITPTFYSAWIYHLVKKGNIVIYPRYQQDLTTPSDNFTPNSVKAIKEALKVLESGNHITPQLDKFAIVGHSVGGLLSVNIASVAASNGLPQPLAVFVVEPGKSRSATDPNGPVLENLTNIPSNTLLLTMAGDQDNWVGDQDARMIIRKTIQIPEGNKDFVMMITDKYGYSPITADHFFPLASSIVVGNYNMTLLTNAQDYYGTWKLFDGLYDAAFYGQDREFALGNTTQQRFMGFWSDGTKIKELNITDNP